MSDAVKVGFVPFSAVPRGRLVVFCDDTLKFRAATCKALGTAADVVKRAAENNSSRTRAARRSISWRLGSQATRLIVVGAGSCRIEDVDFLKSAGSGRKVLRREGRW